MAEDSASDHEYQRISVSQPEYERNVSDLMKNLGIGGEDARIALDSSGPIMDFQTEHASDPAFGAVWVTYENGYELHVRTLDDSLEEAIQSLESAVGRRAVRHTGGAPFAVLDAASGFVFERKLFDVSYTLNWAEGYFDLYAGSGVPSDDVVDPKWVRMTEEVLEPVPAASAYGGDDVQRWIGGASYTDECTMGFGYEYSSPQVTGWYTAGHCQDGSGRAGGFSGYEYTANTYASIESCAGPNGADYQAQEIQYNHSPRSTALDKRFSPWIPVNYSIAGGFYNGQPVLKVGLTGNGAIGTNAGVVQGYGTRAVANAGDCAGGNFDGFNLSNDADHGDSGGPILLWYNSYYYLGGITTTVNADATPIWNIALPPGGHICHDTNPC